VSLLSFTPSAKKKKKSLSLRHFLFSAHTPLLVWLSSFAEEKKETASALQGRRGTPPPSLLRLRAATGRWALLLGCRGVVWGATLRERPLCCPLLILFFVCFAFFSPLITLLVVRRHVYAAI
jgi:hypothetical protein